MREPWVLVALLRGGLLLLGDRPAPLGQLLEADHLGLVGLQQPPVGPRPEGGPGLQRRPGPAGRACPEAPARSPARGGSRPPSRRGTARTGRPAAAGRRAGRRRG